MAERTFLWSTEALGTSMRTAARPAGVVAAEAAGPPGEERALIRWASRIVHFLVEQPLSAAALTAALERQDSSRFDPLEIGIALSALERKGAIRRESDPSGLSFRLTDAGRDLA